MTGNTKRAKTAGASNREALTVTADPNKTSSRQLADIALDPAAHAAAATRMFTQSTFGAQDSTDLFASMLDKGKAAKSGDLGHYKAMLAAQADTLNCIFTEMARRAAVNMGEYIGATESYMRLGLKAQTQCRATIEALDRLTSGRVQTVKLVHVNEGGQAIVADEFHQHTGGQENGQSIEQPHATGTAGESPSLSGPDSLGNGVPIPGGKGESAVPHARRQR